MRDYTLTAMGILRSRKVFGMVKISEIDKLAKYLEKINYDGRYKILLTNEEINKIMGR